MIVANATIFKFFLFQAAERLLIYLG
ncbi:hypothetical protein FHS14_005463 [Paenibacillus baekrokdamisoli]|nr:hypothetical protein [Paenibacillus baekrokdamisoli]